MVNMSRIVLAFSLFAVLVSCTSRYKINGESSVSSLDGKMLFLKTLRSNKLIKVDSAEVIHGLFKMEGCVDSAEMVMLFMGENIIMPIILENGKINVRIDNTEIRANGTPLNNALYTFFDKKNEIDRRVNDLEHREAKMILNGDEPISIKSEINLESKRIVRDMNNLIKDFITENCNNVLGPGVFLLLCQSSPIMTPQIEEILSKVPSTFRDNPYVKSYIATARENLNMMKEHEVSTVARQLEMERLDRKREHSYPIHQ